VSLRKSIMEITSSLIQLLVFEFVASLHALNDNKNTIETRSKNPFVLF